MKKVFWLILVVICALIISSALADDFVYHGTHWGDSSKIVKLNEELEIRYEEEANGFYVLAYKYQFEERWGELGYVFKDDKLIEIYQWFSSTDSLYKSLKKYLNQQYKKSSDTKTSTIFDYMERYGYDKTNMKEDKKHIESMDIWKSDKTFIYLIRMDNGMMKVYFFPSDEDFKKYTKE